MAYPSEVTTMSCYRFANGFAGIEMSLLQLEFDDRSGEKWFAPELPRVPFGEALASLDNKVQLIR
ncbi:MAG TPA: hypothetical protein EYQ22_04270 [Gammaproteobacteria bacterium]|nr:hypothetical protein [Gammaproteobacteria bacterium]